MSSPLQEYNQAHGKRWKVLVDIPEWEQQSLFNWLYAVFNRKTEDMYGSTHTAFNSSIIRGIETRNRLLLQKDLRINADSWSDLRNSLSTLMATESKRVILFLELLVKFLRDSSDRNMFYGSNLLPPARVIGFLQSILDNGSVWSVVFDVGSDAGFVERVDQNITAIAKDLKDKELDTAWQLAFQPTPSPEKAIEHAQSAIESVASRHNLTTATSKVYGTLLGDIKARKSESYVSIAKPAFDLSNVLAGKKSTETDVNDQFTDWFVTGLNIIQKSNPARHKSKTTTAFQVSPETAKQAVLIATLICHFIEQGYIAKVENKAKIDKGSNDF
jgi:hypothetical protein